MADIPNADGDFNTYQASSIAYILAHNPGKWNFGSVDLDPLTGAQATWNVAYPAALNGQATAKALNQAKDDARGLKPGGLEPQLRIIRKRIDSHPATTNADRVALGLPIPGEPPPSGGVTPASYPRPGIRRIDREEMTIEWVDSVTEKRAKPPGVAAALIFMAITDQGAPVPPSNQFAQIARDTGSPYTMDFSPGDAGKVVHINMCWEANDGTTGPLCPTLSITIVG